jgi:aminoglycoside phosphotransferase (APT) family kinase protein
MEQLLRLLESIPDRNTLIHGDYHPNNIMVKDGELIMIDLGDFSIGHPVFDFLATAATQANLVELSPEYAEIHTKMKAERIRKGWSILLEQYFSDRTPQQRGEIDAQIRLLSKLKVACAPAVAKGISNQLMEASINDVKENLIPRIDGLIGIIDW